MATNKWKYSPKKKHEKSKNEIVCLQVKAIRDFDINGMMGSWYIVQYYASSEEAAEYACMKCNFSMNPENVQVSTITHDHERPPLSIHSIRTDNNGL